MIYRDGNRSEGQSQVANMNMQKLLYIVTLPDWGGAQRYIFDLANALNNEFDITVACGQMERNRSLLTKCEEKNIATKIFSNLVRSVNPLKDILAITQIAEYIDKEKPDIVHLNSSKAGVLGSLAAAVSRHKPKIIYTVHGWVFMEPINILKRKLYIFLERVSSRFRDTVIVLGHREKQIAINCKICEESKIKIVSHAIPAFHFLSKEEARRTFNLPTGKIIAGTIANFFAAKGIKYLVEAAAETDDQNIIFAIIGDGAMRDEIEKNIAGSSLKEKIKFLGAIEEAYRYLSAFDIFVLPSIKEGAPYAILEAMHAGLPIVATDVGSVKEMLADYQNKIIVAPADAKALKEAILAIKPLHSSKNFKSFDDFVQEMREIYNS